MERSEAEDWIDDVAFDPDLDEERILEVAEQIAPGNADVEKLLRDLSQTYFVSDSTLEYYADRLQRIMKKSSAE